MIHRKEDSEPKLKIQDVFDVKFYKNTIDLFFLFIFFKLPNNVRRRDVV